MRLFRRWRRIALMRCERARRTLYNYITCEISQDIRHEQEKTRTAYVMLCAVSERDRRSIYIYIYILWIFTRYWSHESDMLVLYIYLYASTTSASFSFKFLRRQFLIQVLEAPVSSTLYKRHETRHAFSSMSARLKSFTNVILYFLYTYIYGYTWLRSHWEHREANISMLMIESICV